MVQPGVPRFAYLCYLGSNCERCHALRNHDFVDALLRRVVAELVLQAVLEAGEEGLEVIVPLQLHLRKQVERVSVTNTVKTI